MNRNSCEFTFIASRVIRVNRNVRAIVVSDRLYYIPRNKDLQQRRTVNELIGHSHIAGPSTNKSLCPEVVPASGAALHSCDARELNRPITADGKEIVFELETVNSLKLPGVYTETNTPFYSQTQNSKSSGRIYCIQTHLCLFGTGLV